MVNEDASSIVFGVVSKLNERLQEYPKGSGRQQSQVWIELAGGSVTLMALNVKADRFPAEGSFACFHVSPSRSGKTAMIHRWGWVDASGKGSLPDVLSVDWKLDLSTSSTRQVVGVSR